MLVAEPTGTLKAASVIYSYTGTNASLDSFITAWFEFDTGAMADGGVGFYDIGRHSFSITGADTVMNGEYDRFLGGGIGFATAVPGPQNLPIIQSLVIQNSKSLSMVLSDHYGTPEIFVGGNWPTPQPVYSGRWSFGIIPEPQSLHLVILGLAFWRFCRPTRQDRFRVQRFRRVSWGHTVSMLPGTRLTYRPLHRRAVRASLGRFSSIRATPVKRQSSRSPIQRSRSNDGAPSPPR